jgi:hypothetical protein
MAFYSEYFLKVENFALMVDLTGDAVVRINASHCVSRPPVVQNYGLLGAKRSKGLD